MIEIKRWVTFMCGHTAHRLTGGGRSLRGRTMRCHWCNRDRLIVWEEAPHVSPAHEEIST